MAQDDINVTQTLMEIKEDVASIKTKIDDLQDANKNADKALAKSIENEHRIDNLSTIQNWLIALLVTGIVVPVGIYILEKFF